MPAEPMALRRIDHVRMFVGNARQSAYFYRNAFGFEVVAYAGLETGVKHEACYVLRQGQITLVLASPLRADHPDAGRLIQHGDGVQSIALEVDDVAAAFESAVARGAARPCRPTRWKMSSARMDLAEIHAYGDTTHTLVNRSRYQGVFAPGFRPAGPDRYSPRTFHPVGLKAIDHIVANVEEGQDGRLGRLLQQGHGVLAAGQLRRQGHQHGVLGADVQGCRRRPRADQVPDQRAGQEPAPVADRRVPRLLRRPRRAAYRHGHRRHRGERAGDGRQRCLVPQGAAGLLRDAARTAWARSGKT